MSCSEPRGAWHGAQQDAVLDRQNISLAQQNSLQTLYAGSEGQAVPKPFLAQISRLQEDIGHNCKSQNSLAASVPLTEALLDVS